MKLRPLSPALGVEVRGLDASSKLDSAERARLRAAIDKHHLLLLRNQKLDEAQQLAFAELFGPAIDELADGHKVGLLSNVVPNAAGSGALPFHSDLSFTISPVIGICLLAVELPAEPTSTWFANSQLAWRTLPPALRARLVGRRVQHALAAMAAGGRADAKSRDFTLDANAPRVSHLLPLRHPRTSEPVLYLTDLHAEAIEGVASDESDALLAEAFTHLYSDEHIYEHQWRLGDLLMWDNAAVQHRATFDYDLPLRRLMYRTTVRGTAPY